MCINIEENLRHRRPGRRPHFTDLGQVKSATWAVGFKAGLDEKKDYFDYFNSLEELGMYLREGLLDIRFVTLLAGGSIIAIWEKYESISMYFRESMGSRFLTEAEYLYTKTKEYVEKHPELAPDR